MISDTTYLLRECNSGCKMASGAMEQVMPHVRDQKLSDLLHKYNEKHLDIGASCHELLTEDGDNGKDPHPLTRAMSWMSTEMKLNISDDNSTVAGLLMDGCSMGIKSLSRYLNQYPEASGESRELTRKLIHLEEDFMMQLKSFV